MNTRTKVKVSPVGRPQIFRAAVVTVFDIKFRDIFEAPGDGAAKRASVHKMEMRTAAAPHRVLISPEDNTLTIMDRGATIQFAFQGKEYYPIAMAFTLANGKGSVGDKKRLGQLNFSQAKIKPGDHSLSVTDLFMDKRADAKFKFSIIIQRAKDGKIGIIDCRAVPSRGKLSDDCRPPTAIRISNVPGTGGSGGGP